MTPQEHVATLLAMTDDFLRTLDSAGERLREAGDDAYWRYIEEYGFSEGMWIPTTAAESGPDEEPDEMYTDDPELMARAAAILAGRES